MVELEAKQGSAVSKSTGENCEKNSDPARTRASYTEAAECQPCAVSLVLTLPPPLSQDHFLLAYFTSMRVPGYAFLLAQTLAYVYSGTSLMWTQLSP